MSDAPKRASRGITWEAFFSWGMAIVTFAVVQAVRTKLIAIFGDQYGAGLGFIPLAEPNQSGIGFTLGRFYRLMHNLTVPYVMVLYVLAFVLAFLWFRRRERGRRGRDAFKLASMSIHLAFLVSWGISLFMPIHVTGGRLVPPEVKGSNGRHRVERSLPLPGAGTVGRPKAPAQRLGPFPRDGRIGARWYWPLSWAGIRASVIAGR